MKKNPTFISVSSTYREVANFVADDKGNYQRDGEVIRKEEVWSEVASVMTKIDKPEEGEFIVLNVSSGVAIMVTLVKRDKYNMRIPFIELSKIQRIEVLWENESKILVFLKSNEGKWYTEYDVQTRYDEAEIKRIFYQLVLEEGFCKKQRVTLNLNNSSYNITIS